MHRFVQVPADNLALSSQLRNSIREAYQKGYKKRDLIFLIQMSIKDFSAVKGTPFREAINNVITSESAKYGFRLIFDCLTKTELSCLIPSFFL